ncbi:MAG: hypothetical protein K0S51_1220 [Bacillales bacterium]|jgi:hypothetical protein|nr:hypothetical protein [Bacillales bacterium]
MKNKKLTLIISLSLIFAFILYFYLHSTQNLAIRTHVFFTAGPKLAIKTKAFKMDNYTYNKYNEIEYSEEEGEIYQITKPMRFLLVKKVNNIYIVKKIE